MTQLLEANTDLSAVGLISTPLLTDNFSIEVTPNTATKVADFCTLLPPYTTIYIANVEGTPVDDMVLTSKRLVADGFSVIPHITARSIRNLSEFERLIYRYREEAGVTQALVLAGGMKKPWGELESSLDLLKTNLFDKLGFTEIHVAGHPEGSKDIDPLGGSGNADAALREKWQISLGSDVRMALVTQFVFSEKPVIAWVERLEESGILFPVYVGIPGPTKIQTLLKYAVICGIGPSLKILQKRAKDITKFLLPFEATEIAQSLTEYKLKHADSLISGLHIYSLGGIQSAAEWGCKLSVQPIR